MASNNEERSSGYQALTQTKDKQRRGKRAKKERPSSPDSRDADTEECGSENDGIPAFKKETTEPENSCQKSQFSTQRRVCLVGSLLLCVFTIFAFAFILPCHHKSCKNDKDCGNEPLKHWAKNFTGVTPLVLRDVDGKNNSANLLVGFSGSLSGSHNTSCPGRKCQAGILSVKGCNGRSLWSSGIDGMLGKIQCDVHGKNHFQAGCFVQESNDKIVYVDTDSGNRKWKAGDLGDIKSFRTIRDINGDGIKDVLLLMNGRPKLDLSKRTESAGRESLLRVLSGKSGKLIGTSVSLLIYLSASEHAFLRVHCISASLQYILIGLKLESKKTGTLLAIELEDLSGRIHNSSKIGRKTPWGPNKPNQYGFIELFRNSLVLMPPIFGDLNDDGVEDIVLCTLDNGVTVQALNGKDAVEIWSRKLTVRESNSDFPVIVSIGKHLIDIAIMIKLSNQSSRIVVLNGKNGSARWLFPLIHPLPVPPVGVPEAEGIPAGLLLWLPKSKVNKYLKAKDRKFHMNDEAVEKKAKSRRNGPRRRRDLSIIENDVVMDAVVDDLLEMMLKEDKKSQHEAERSVDRITTAEEKDNEEDYLNDENGAGDDNYDGLEDFDDDGKNDVGVGNDSGGKVGDIAGGVSDDKGVAGGSDDIGGGSDDGGAVDNGKKDVLGNNGGGGGEVSDVAGGVSNEGVGDVDDNNGAGNDDGGKRDDTGGGSDNGGVGNDSVVVRSNIVGEASDGAKIVNNKDDGGHDINKHGNNNNDDDDNYDDKDGKVDEHLLKDVQKERDKNDGNKFDQRVQRTDSEEGRRSSVNSILESLPDKKRHRNNSNDHQPSSYIISKLNYHLKASQHFKPSKSEQTGSANYFAMKNFLKNWENRLRREERRNIKPITTLPTPRTTFQPYTDSPNTEEESSKMADIQSTMSFMMASEEIRRTIDTTKRKFPMSKQNDKSFFLACDKREKDLSQELSVVLVYRDPKQHRLQMKEITEDGVITLGPQEFKKQFGKPPPTVNCQHFVPKIRSKPIVKDIDGDGQLDLIYALEYINTVSPTSANEYRTEHFMKIRKVDILDAMLKRKSKNWKYSNNYNKKYRRNEDFESPFLQWKTE